MARVLPAPRHRSGATPVGGADRVDQARFGVRLDQGGRGTPEAQGGVGGQGDLVRRGSQGRTTTARARVSTLVPLDRANRASTTLLPSSFSSTVPLISMLAP